MAADGTHEKLLNAATRVFVEKGFSGARVDEIARQARANKAMIYYHFGDKLSLYRAVLLRLLSPIHEHIATLGRARLGPRERLAAFYAGIVQRFAEKPALPHVMIREILAGGRHMDRETAQAFAGILSFVSRTLDEGRRAGSFPRVNPLLLHLSVIGPIFLFFVSTTFRDRVKTVAAPQLAFPSTDELLAQIDALLERSLEPMRLRESHRR